jgi:hypothetical protein
LGLKNIKDKLKDLSWLGEDYADQGWVEVEEKHSTPKASPAILAWEKAKELLRQSDWVVLGDVKMTSAERQKWIAYRLSLRNIRSQPNFPNDIKWPTKPE